MSAATDATRVVDELIALHRRAVDHDAVVQDGVYDALNGLYRALPIRADRPVHPFHLGLRDQLVGLLDALPGWERDSEWLRLAVRWCDDVRAVATDLLDPTSPLYRAARGRLTARGSA